MKLTMLSVHDSKAEAFIQPFFAANVAVALRMFKQATNDPNSDFCKFAEDYTLFELGTFNSETGMVTYHDSPKSVSIALTLKDNPTNG